MRTDDLIRTVTLDGQQVSVVLGDVVWYFGAAQTASTPLPATVVAFGGPGLVDLVFTEPTTGKSIAAKGVCMATDPRLENMNNRKRGSWAPRGLWSFLGTKSE